MERLATNNALQAPDPAGPDALQEIARRRAAVAANFRPGLEVLSGRNFANKDQLIRDLRLALDRADDFRRRADEAIRLPRAQRDEVLRRDFIPTITASVNAALGVWFAASHSVASVDPVLARLAVIKEIGWRLRDTAGFERSNVASAIAAQQPVAADKVAANAAIRARVDLLWDQFSNLAPTADPATHPALRAAVATAQREYFQGFRQLADRMVTAGAAGGQYPTQAGPFVDTTTAQLGTLLDVMHAAGRASEGRTAELVSDARRSLALSASMLLVTIMAAGAMLWLVNRRVSKPLATLAAATQELANGNLSQDIPGAGRGDEVGSLADALLILRDGARRAKDEAGQMEKERAAAAEDRRRARLDTANAFDATVGSLIERMSGEAKELEGAADRMMVAAEQSAQDATEAARGAEQASGNVQQVAAAAEQLNASVSEITRQVAQAAEVARRAVERTQETDTSVQFLADGAKRIQDVVRLISEIAAQTNLLALNATIEAARAGEAGKGFAVVASEVKNLASQTAKATDEITQQITAIQSATNEAVDAVRGIGQVVSEVDGIASAIAAAVEEQGAATQEIARTIGEAAAGTAAVSANLGGARSAAEQTSAAVQSLRRVSVSVSGHASNMRDEVGKVVNQLRA